MLKTKIIITSIVIFISCVSKKEVYPVGSSDFFKKEKQLKYSYKEAFKVCSGFLKKENSKEVVSLDIIYGNNYIFKQGRQHYNRKTGYYNVSGIWINGNTGEIKNITKNKKIKIRLLFPRPLYINGKIIKNEMEWDEIRHKK